MKYCSYVNTKQGSFSRHRFSNGNTLPLVQLPFGMNALCVQTSSQSSWFFDPSDRCVEGVRITHQPSPWIADYGTVVFLPQKFSPAFDGGARYSGYRPEDAVFSPYYLKLNLLRPRCVFECVPTVRGGALRIRFDSGEKNWFSVLPLEDYCEYRYVPGENTLYGAVTNCGAGKNFKMYFVVKFENGQISADENLAVTRRSSVAANNISGDMTGIHLKVTGSCVDAVFATSYISYEQAKLNLEQDTEGRDFDSLKDEAEEVWEEYLSRVEIEACDEKQMRTFYSCMYRAFLYPHRCYETGPDGKNYHYSPFDAEIREGVRYTDNGFWDTYRTVYPFFSLVARDEYREMCRGFVNDFLECGWLPRWLSIGEQGCMPSTLVDAVLCDAAVKGIMDRETMVQALEGMLKHANVNSPDDDYGRSGAESYCRLGYVPLEVHKESVNLTLDAAYGDWCIARIAELCGRNDIVGEYDRRSKNYRNLFDRKTGFMRARSVNGEFRPDFSPTSWGRDYTEGSAWQNSFAVPHDIEGLAELYGGKDRLEEKTDELFSTEPVYEIGGYGSEIHEITEMAAVSFGQCAISNQPSFHIPYIYSELGNVEKTSYWVEKICRELFSYEDDGFPGDEDNGTMALWYVFSCIGIYPFCPGRKDFVRTKKLVKSVKILGREFDADRFSGSRIKYEDVIGG